jgi:hypothetical protein
MGRQPETFTPSMSDAAVKAKTGKEWDDWFATLDQAGAAYLDHPAIATLLSNNYALPGFSRHVEEGCVSRDRLLRKGPGQVADRRAGQQAREARGRRARA